ncbi:MAG TPA: hypothetical protein VM912_12045 [Terriglobales bacterium]|nr:hypothetical protein [Terriglobales bacterium]
MNFGGWALFWTVWLVVAGVAFASITAIVTAFGLRDLKSLFRLLQKQDQGE